MVMKKTAPAEPPVVEREVLLAELDCSPAAGVRADRPELAAAVAEYAAANLTDPDCLPAIDLFAGPRARYVGDGRTRVQALTANRRERIKARVRTYPTDAEALAAARRHAFGANATHGLPRTDDDKHRAVRLYLLTPGNADGSDYEAVKACRVNKVVVKKVRTKLTKERMLTGKAAAGPHRYNDWSDLPTDTADPPEYGRAANSDAGSDDGLERGDAWEPPAVVPSAHRPRPPAYPTTDQPAPAVTPEPIHDERGRVVPSALVEVFAARAAFRSLTAKLGHWWAEAEQLAGGPGGVGLAQVLNPCRQLKESLSGDVWAAAPFVACPSCRAGEAADPKACRQCHGSGWLSRQVYQQLGPALKAACEPDSAAPSPCPTDPAPASAAGKPSLVLLPNGGEQ